VKLVAFISDRTGRSAEMIYLPYWGYCRHCSFLPPPCGNALCGRL
jgi:hypothetical protein